MIPAYAFYFFSALAIVFSLNVVFRKNPVSAAFSLVLVFFSFAAIYALLGAHLVAALQVLVYAGAIMVLFVFVIMLLNADVPSLDRARAHPVVKMGIALLVLGAFIALTWAFKKSGVTGIRGPFTPEAVQAAGGNTRVISQLMFSSFILPFELTSVLLLAGIVGSVALAKRNRKKENQNATR